MNKITSQELKNCLEQKQEIQVIMALNSNAYQKIHIPGSVQFDDLRTAAQNLSRDQDVVIYCSNPACPASYRAYYLLRSMGFQKLYRLEGGLEEWVKSGYPVEGQEGVLAYG